MKTIINIYAEDWIEEVAHLAFSNHLICTGKRSDLQWLGTMLIQKLANYPSTETSPIYGKLAVNFDDFCYQLCHSTPWGFDMGRNINAVRDVIRGEGLSQNKFFIIYDAQFLYLDDFKSFENLWSVFLEVAEEYEEEDKNLKVIILLEKQEKINARRLIRRKEKFPIEVLEVIQEEKIE